VKKVLALLVAIASVAMLSSCMFNPSHKGINEGARDRVDQIAVAIVNQDAGALKGLFSTRALERATAIDEQLDYLLSLFPEGSEISCDLFSLTAPKSVRGGETTEMVIAMYEVKADGRDLWLFFADYTQDELDPDNLGLYALGVAPRTESIRSEAELAMYEWNGQFDLGEGTPGVYVPES
jgi:hypothetical protein